MDAEGVGVGDSGRGRGGGRAPLLRGEAAAAGPPTIYMSVQLLGCTPSRRRPSPYMRVALTASPLPPVAEFKRRKWGGSCCRQKAQKILGAGW